MQVEKKQEFWEVNGDLSQYEGRGSWRDVIYCGLGLEGNGEPLLSWGDWSGEGREMLQGNKFSRKDVSGQWQ